MKINKQHQANVALCLESSAMPLRCRPTKLDALLYINYVWTACCYDLVLVVGMNTCLEQMQRAFFIWEVTVQLDIGNIVCIVLKNLFLSVKEFRLDSR